MKCCDIVDSNRRYHWYQYYRNTTTPSINEGMKEEKTSILIDTRATGEENLREGMIGNKKLNNFGRQNKILVEKSKTDFPRAR